MLLQSSSFDFNSHPVLTVWMSRISTEQKNVPRMTLHKEEITKGKTQTTHWSSGIIVGEVLATDLPPKTETESRTEKNKHLCC